MTERYMPVGILMPLAPKTIKERLIFNDESQINLVDSEDRFIPGIKIPNLEARERKIVERDYEKALTRIYETNGIPLTATPSQIETLALEEPSLTLLFKTIKVPNKENLYYKTHLRYPKLERWYEINVLDLNLNQVTRLANGEPVREVLGNPQSNISILDKAEIEEQERDYHQRYPNRKPKGYTAQAREPIKTGSFTSPGRSDPTGGSTSRYSGRHAD